MGQWVQSEIVFEGKIIEVAAGKWADDDGRLWHYDIVRHQGGVAVVPLLGDEVILVRQPRVVVGERLLEIPAGKLEGPDDDVVARAQAELGEEAGYQAGRLIPVAQFYVSPGYCTERIHVFLGLDLVPVGVAPEVSEDIELVRLSLVEVRQRLDEGRFRDSKTIIGLRELLAYLGKPGYPMA